MFIATAITILSCSLQVSPGKFINRHPQTKIWKSIDEPLKQH